MRPEDTAQAEDVRLGELDAVCLTGLVIPAAIADEGARGCLMGGSFAESGAT
jgi:hypothetical protein